MLVLLKNRAVRDLIVKTDFIKGIIVPIITPVDNEENIDEQKLRFMVDHVIEGGVHGILAFGSNGEFYMFNDEEAWIRHNDGSSERTCSNILWHWVHSYETCRSACKNGRSKWSRWYFYLAANVP